MSEADTRPSIGDDVTAEDCRRVAEELREKGQTQLPDRLDEYADQLEAETDE